MKMSYKNLIHILFFTICGIVYSQSPFIDPLITTTLQSSPTADILCILKTSNQDIKKHTDHFSTKNEKGEYVFNTLRAEAEKTQKEIKKYLSRNGYAYRAFYIVNGIHVAKADRDLVEYLMRREEVERIVYNYSYYLDPAMSKKFHNSIETRGSVPSWGIKRIKADSLWALGIKGRGAVICCNDTGVDLISPLKSNYRGYRTNGSYSHDYNWHDVVHPFSNYNGNNICGLDTLAPCDDFGHGTRILSVMISNDSNVSIAPEAKWIATRILGSAVGTVAMSIEGLEWNLAPTNTKNQRPDPSKAPDVVNNSWNCGGNPACSRFSYPVFNIAIDNLVSAGIFVVQSAGNDGSQYCGSIDNTPSTSENAFTVGAMDENDSLSYFSSIGPVTFDQSERLKPNLIAPGREIPTYNKSSLIQFSLGTSVAAPHVTASVALLISALPGLSGRVDLIRHILQVTASPNVFIRKLCGNDTPLSIPNNNVGYGLINVFAAYKYGKKFLEDERLSDAKANLLIYPNPVSTELTISTKFKLINSIRLLDLNGRLLQKWDNLNIDQLKIRFEYPLGVYLLTTVVGKQYITKKIIKL